MTTPKQWAFGDKVIHTAKPEWGAGVVTAAQGSTQDGQPCQSLTIRFDRAGVKTISTAFAKLVPAGEAPLYLAAAAAQAAPAPAAADSARGVSPVSPGTSPVSRGEGFSSGGGLGAGGSGGLEPLVAPDPKVVMTRLPEAATDPFATPAMRLKATLNLYRFTPTGASLLDWAAIQSGLADPMSRFNRHELERFFEAFAVVRDGHLKKVVQEMKKVDPAGLAQALAQAPAAAQQAIRRLDALR